MSYEDALKATGAKVLKFGEWGDYQGTWIAKVEIEGQVHYVKGEYGSCSGCDAFEAEMPWDNTSEKYKVKLVEFGKELLDPDLLYTREELLKKFTEQASWDLSADDLVEWLEEE
jgi:hypothetical protein